VAYVLCVLGGIVVGAVGMLFVFKNNLKRIEDLIAKLPTKV